VVVVLKEGDLTQEEADTIEARTKGYILFFVALALYLFTCTLSEGFPCVNGLPTNYRRTIT
jgi:hypothetical protein